MFADWYLSNKVKDYVPEEYFKSEMFYTSLLLFDFSAAFVSFLRFAWKKENLTHDGLELDLHELEDLHKEIEEKCNLHRLRSDFKSYMNRVFSEYIIHRWWKDKFNSRLNWIV